ncbi:NAD(P)H-dependent oxidoreductase [Stenotrophomonas maltophilia]|uniref:NADPH-dependent FMN reductase n=1 Tax=Stenotrophomonas maltophilia TaxID=40324 RepID=UPI001E3773F6|nr:NAD(P)H-dependent oxidoreductase [Stenotrophomonas maltophilia]MCD5964394.1 NAD(P)H-dependent oxidoreductase [Stenotrophomonas maltophilia]
MSDNPPPLNILAFAGSLRSNSYNRRLVRAAAGAAPAGLLLTVHDTIADRPVAIIGATPGHWGTKLAQSQLRHTLTAMGALTMASPQLYVAEAAAAYDDDAEGFDAATRKRLQRFLEGFQSWVQLLQGGASRG